MQQGQLCWIVNYFWGIADDVLRDLYVRGKYRDVILPMTVLRRLDTLLEGTKDAVLGMKASLDTAGGVHQGKDLASVRIGYEISFNRYFYKPKPLRSLEEICAEILALERETDGLLAEIIGGEGA